MLWKVGGHVQSTIQLLLLLIPLVCAPVTVQCHSLYCGYQCMYIFTMCITIFKKIINLKCNFVIETELNHWYHHVNNPFTQQTVKGPTCNEYHLASTSNLSWKATETISPWLISPASHNSPEHQHCHNLLIITQSHRRTTSKIHYLQQLFSLGLSHLIINQRSCQPDIIVDHCQALVLGLNNTGLLSDVLLFVFSSSTIYHSPFPPCLGPHINTSWYFNSLCWVWLKAHSAYSS